jgi:hypothetical protein
MAERAYKVLQLGIMVGIGSVGSNFEQFVNDENYTAFWAATILLGIHRGLLALQYLIIATQLPRPFRTKGRQGKLMGISAMYLSTCILCLAVSGSCLHSIASCIHSIRAADRCLLMSTAC